MQADKTLGAPHPRLLSCFSNDVKQKFEEQNDVSWCRGLESMFGGKRLQPPFSLCCLGSRLRNRTVRFRKGVILTDSQKSSKLISLRHGCVGYETCMAYPESNRRRSPNTRLCFEECKSSIRRRAVRLSPAIFQTQGRMDLLRRRWPLKLAEGYV